jgi:hypothetical protein
VPAYQFNSPGAPVRRMTQLQKVRMWHSRGNGVHRDGRRGAHPGRDDSPARWARMKWPCNCSSALVAQRLGCLSRAQWSLFGHESPSCASTAVARATVAARASRSGRHADRQWFTSVAPFSCDHKFRFHSHERYYFCSPRISRMLHFAPFPSIDSSIST